MTSKNKECEEKKGKNPQKDYKEIRECADFANFIMNVVGPRRKTLDKRRKDLLLNNNLYEKVLLTLYLRLVITIPKSEK